MILVSAPAGYGKSTLVSTWLCQQESPTAWLSLDDQDNDPSRFLAYLTAAFRKIDPSIDESLDSTLGYNLQLEVELLLTPLINHLAQLKYPFYIVLDDFHMIQDQTIHHAVSFLLENRPEALHLVISTRADPPLPLARLRARCEMLELRMADLRFTLQEAADFLNHTMGLKIAADDVAHITRRTEGWIAGLQMAALSMQNTNDVSGFITTFTGSHHYIYDYLLEEILAHQPPEIQNFLLNTSILDQLTAPLCDALLDGDEESRSTTSSSSILETLDHANLFIVPLDHEQRWYRYHPLFAELLRGYLRKNNPQQIPALHSRASTWFEEQGMISDAIRHSFEANDGERIVRLISANIFALLEQNELNSVARQLQNLTNEKISARPWLLIGRAWLAAYTGQLTAVEPILDMAEAEFSNLNSQADLEMLGGHIAIVRAYVNWIGDKRDIAAKAAQVALEWLPETEFMMRCLAATLLGLTLNDFKTRSLVFKQALAYARDRSVSHVTIFAHACWAWFLAMQGRLHEAYAACQEAIRLAQSSRSSQPLPTLSHVHSTLSFLYCEWNDLERAVQSGNQAVDLAYHWGQADALHFALDNLGYALFAAGDVPGAFNTLHQAWEVAQRTSTWLEEISISQEVSWYIALDNIEAALKQMRIAKLDIDKPKLILSSSFKSQLTPLTIVQISIYQKQYHKALTLIDHLLEDQEKKGVGYHFVRLLTWQALAYHGLGQDKSALASLGRALKLAAPENYIHSFINSGTGLIDLLYKVRREGFLTDYIDKLIALIEQGGKHQLSQAQPYSQLVEPLSARELEVLKLLAQGCTDKKIAESLVIARETVHKHLKNIYGKLDVHSRAEATLRAQELGIL